MSKLIGSGAQGSIYRPPLDCIDESSGEVMTFGDDMVGKYMDRTTAMDQIAISKEIDRIDPDELYHIKIQSKCVPMKQMLNDPYQVVYKYGGLSLFDYIDKYRSGEITIDAYKFLYGYANVFKAICKLGLNHNDLHSGNILVLDTGTRYKFRLIDFVGSDEPPQDLPEAQLLLDMNSIIKKDDVKLRKYLTAGALGNPIYTPELLDDIIEYVMDNPTEPVITMLKNGSDIYNIGQILYEIITLLGDKIPAAIYYRFVYLVKKCTDLNPFNRGTIEQLYNYYSKTIILWIEILQT